MNDYMEAFYSIQKSFGLGSSDASGPDFTESLLFLSIDLEYNPKCITQLGISVFDSRTLAPAEPLRPISNEYPISSTLYSTKTSRYRQRRRKPSHFGEQRVLRSEELRPLLIRLLTPINELGCPQDVVLVGHSIATDLEVIEKFSGLNVCRDITSVKAVLDTQHISQSIFACEQSLSLKRLLVALELEYIGLHNAAHDSRYTLRALFLMFCRTAQRLCPTTQAISQNQDREQRLTLVEEIARFHKPRERILWCENSPRIKSERNSDVFDWQHDSDGDGDGDDANNIGCLLGSFDVTI